MRSTRRRRHATFVPAILAVLATAAIPSAAHAATGCPAQDQAAATLSAPAVRTATLCLLNAERHAMGRRALRGSAKLAGAARGHSRDMVAHRYFAHDSRSGATFTTRIARTGWMDGRDRWFIGENLAWGNGARSTPRAIMAAWMASPEHRRNIMQRRFRTIGIGVHAGVPVLRGGAGATFTTDFGS